MESSLETTSSANLNILEVENKGLTDEAYLLSYSLRVFGSKFAFFSLIASWPFVHIHLLVFPQLYFANAFVFCNTSVIG